MLKSNQTKLFHYFEQLEQRELRSQLRKIDFLN